MKYFLSILFPVLLARCGSTTPATRSAVKRFLRGDSHTALMNGCVPREGEHLLLLLPPSDIC